MKRKPCDPKDVALKSYYLGPQAENGTWVAATVGRVLEHWFRWRRSLFPDDGRAISEEDIGLPEFQKDREQLESQIRELSRRFESEVPKFSPRYIGHMFSEILLPALFGHIVALLHNPNNVSGESSRVGVEIEDEAIGELLKLTGYDPGAAKGHFTSGGSIANIEALLRARARTALWLATSAYLKSNGTEVGLFEGAHLGWDRFDRHFPSMEKVRPWHFVEQNPWQAGLRIQDTFGVPFRGPVILVPEHRHYSWTKGASILGLGEDALWGIELDKRGKLSVSHLNELICKAQRESRPVSLIVSVAGTTELGTVDPVHEVQNLIREWQARGVHLWHHVDAAYGGYFRTVADLPDVPLSRETSLALTAMHEAHSITLDPHKLGYVPYACGAFLTRCARDYFSKAFVGPYVHFDPKKDRGPFTIEGSRSATGAAATWMTAKTMGFSPDGYARVLTRTLEIKQELERRIRESGLPIQIAPGTDTNILCLTIADRGWALSRSNLATEAVYHEFSPAKQGPFFVSKTRLSWRSYGPFLDAWSSEWSPEPDSTELFLIRLCIMNPFFSSKEMNIDFMDAWLKALASACRQTC